MYNIEIFTTDPDQGIVDPTWMLASTHSSLVDRDAQYARFISQGISSDVLRLSETK